MRRRGVQYPCLLGKGLVTVKDQRLHLPPGYSLDMSDSDVLILRRSDGTSVAAFSAHGADPKELRKAAEEDLCNLEASDERLPNVLRKTRTVVSLGPPHRGTRHRH